MRIILPDLKYADALKDAGISTFFDRRAQLSSHLFEDIVNKPVISSEDYFHRKHIIITI
jgi:hypothetical protein